MIAKVMLTLLLFGVLGYAIIQYAASRTVALLAGFAAAGGLYFVWNPEHANILARRVGVGRGADLILYVWVGISLILLLNLHLKIRAQMEIITSLARAVAIKEAIRETGPIGDPGDSRSRKQILRAENVSSDG